MNNPKSKSTGYDIVRKTQVALYKDSGIDPNDFDSIIDLFSPEILAEYLNLGYLEVEKIHSDDPKIEVAGLLDCENANIYVSGKFPEDQRRLTGMHEIVHWMLHRNSGIGLMHRDRPISHLPKEGSVNFIEWEATHVACQYMMPDKLVRDVFSKTFLLSAEEAFVFNEDTAFHLRKDIDTLKKMNEFERAFLLATTENYGYPIMPLHKQFKISPSAMAIRLRELKLLAPDRYTGKPNLRVIRNSKK